MRYEHYSYKVDESDYAIWYADTRGFIFKKYKKSGITKIVKGYVREGFRVVKINYVECRFSRVIARAFMKNYQEDLLIGYKDGNRDNCSLQNLFLYSRRTHGKKTGYLSKSTPVIVKDFKKDPIEYRSVREAAKHLYVSYQTLLDYLAGRVDHSVLAKWGRKIYYKNEVSI
jgi:hypothetical protein